MQWKWKPSTWEEGVWQIMWNGNLNENINWQVWSGCKVKKRVQQKYIKVVVCTWGNARGIFFYQGQGMWDLGLGGKYKIYLLQKVTESESHFYGNNKATAKTFIGQTSSESWARKTFMVIKICIIYAGIYSKVSIRYLSFSLRCSCAGSSSSGRSETHTSS